MPESFRVCNNVCESLRQRNDVASEPARRHSAHMRLTLVVVLAACGTPCPLVESDAGPPDAGHDAGQPLVVTFLYLDGKAVAPTYDCGSVESCAIATHDDGGLARWQAFYADAGCVFGGNGAVIDCRALCQPDAGNAFINGTCCLHKPRYAYNGMCGWNPP